MTNNPQQSIDEILALHMPIDKDHKKDTAAIKAALLEAIKTAKPQVRLEHISGGNEFAEGYKEGTDFYESNLLKLFGLEG